MADNNATGGSDNIEVLEGSDFDASSATVISQNANDGYGIFSWNGGKITIDTYYDYNNSDGAVDSNVSLSIGEQVNKKQPEIAVPGPDDVGAFASGDSGDSVDDPIFDDWTPRWESRDSEWGVNSTSSNVEDSILELNAS
jgi:hypothetical protein